MSIKLYLTGKFNFDRESLLPRTESQDVELGNKFICNKSRLSWLGKSLNIEKSCRGSIPFIFFFLSKLFRCKRG